MTADENDLNRWNPLAPTRWLSGVPKERVGINALHQRRSRLWLWFVALFALQAAAWTRWFVIASHHPVREVPLKEAASDRR